MTFSEADHRFMSRALELARRGRFTTRPNPQVGCVVVRNDEVVGEGWHQRAGEPHAEVHALRQAGALATGATAYVTLEPCAHHGRTPPCCQALIDVGIRRVVVACEDPFPRVNGQGLQRLRDAGVQVDVGLLREQAVELNRGFLANSSRGRPWVRLKFGMSLDGRTALADGRSKWITGEQAREDVHRWRLASGAILTGSGTLLADDPHLTARVPEVAEPLAPLRVVLDRRLRVPAGARVFDQQAPTLLVHARDARRDASPPAHVERLVLDDAEEGAQLGALLAELGRRGLHDVFVEAGPTLGGALLRTGLVDELLLYVAPRLLGDEARPLLAGLAPASLDAAPAFQLVDTLQLGADLRLRLHPRAPG